jgi:DNA-binding CsgD family transcriptional regulator/catechol 2,3-dioxygenase-like lactoylglutathione lyase family enzyme
MRTRRGRGRPAHPDVLTPAEWQVLDWLRHGVSRREIARRRHTSLDAVKYHVANITGKLGLDGSEQLRRWPGIPADSPLTDRSPDPMTTPIRVDHLGQVALLCRDVTRTEAFYRDTLGLPHLFTFGDLTFFAIGPTRLFVRAVADEEWRAGSLLYLSVPDVHGAHDAVAAAGAKLNGAPHRIHTHDDGTEEWMAFFEDPDGNPLAFMAQVARAAATGA